MPCIPVVLPGGGSAIVCTRGRRRQRRCAWCDRPGTRLCDGRTGTGLVCSAPCCSRHATVIDDDVDLCPDCAPQQAQTPMPFGGAP